MEQTFVPEISTAVPSSGAWTCKCVDRENTATSVYYWCLGSPGRHASSSCSFEMAATYPIAVRSLADMFPDLPQIPTLANHRINEGKAVGDPLNENAAYSAERTVQELEPLRRVTPALPHAHVEGAKNRAHTLRTIHATRAVGAGDIPAVLDEIRRTVDDNRLMLQQTQAVVQQTQAAVQQIQAAMQQHQVMLQMNQAMIANIRLAKQNNMVPRDRDNCTPLQKTTSGHGRSLAIQVSWPEYVNQIPPIAAIQVAEVGTCPPFWNPVTDGYTMRNISQLIIFYNDDFGIQPADNVELAANCKLVVIPLSLTVIFLVCLCGIKNLWCHVTDKTDPDDILGTASHKPTPVTPSGIN
ncbi:hypothetical protein EV702DRAFT_1049172 [Suillus placidus]|uniref:Uncharacterized protein n=1 Tax=Suillus placidus TaxID=48579 RepID=A0A9P6ZL55_9AGAM|nr:hypothetical protein EV702DRAFT_1049172 [Suillus placidus]